MNEILAKDERPSNQFVPSWGEIGVFVFAIAGMWFFIAIWG